MEDGSVTWGYGGMGLESTEGQEASGLLEAKAGAELAGGCAEDTAAEGGVEGAEPVDFDGYGEVAGSCADGTASATDGFAGEEELGQETGDLVLPAGFFFACQFSKIR
jgi:hypothetical protein